MIRIIEAGLSDIVTIQTLAAEIWPITFKNILSMEQISYMMDMMYSTASLEQQIQDHKHRFLLAQDNDCYIGYLSFELNYKQVQKTKIHKVYLLPDTQGRGIGRQLFEEVSAIASQHSNHTLSLNVNRDNKAVSFYEKIGFKIVGEENIPIGNGFLMEDYIMERSV